MEQAVVQVVAQALAEPEHAGGAGNQHQSRAQAVGDVDADQTAGAFEIQRQLEQTVFEGQQGKQQEYRQVVQVCGYGVAHGGFLSGKCIAGFQLSVCSHGYSTRVWSLRSAWHGTWPCVAGQFRAEHARLLERVTN
ncbi:hypothetical protein D9M68_803310 [compost metagenome]